MNFLMIGFANKHNNWYTPMYNNLQEALQDMHATSIVRVIHINEIGKTVLKEIDFNDVFCRAAIAILEKSLLGIKSKCPEGKLEAIIDWYKLKHSPFSAEMPEPETSFLKKFSDYDAKDYRGVHFKLVTECHSSPLSFVSHYFDRDSYEIYSAVPRFKEDQEVILKMIEREINKRLGG